MLTLTLIKCRECKWQGDVEELQIDKQSIPYDLSVTSIHLCPKCDSFDLDWGIDES